MMQQPRNQPGASLVLTLCVLVLVECLILGTLHLATLERQVAVNGEAVLRLRLAAETALARGAAHWSETVEDAMQAGASLSVWEHSPADGMAAAAVLYPLGSGLLLLLRARAWELHPGTGSAAAAALVLPPLLSPRFQPGGDLTPAGVDSVLHRLLGGIGAGTGPPGALVLDDGVVFSGVAATVVVGRGDLRLDAGARVTGVVFAAGTLILDPDAHVIGATVARRVVVAEGAGVALDPGGAEVAIAAARMRLPRPVPGRSRVPSF